MENRTGDEPVEQPPATPRPPWQAPGQTSWQAPGQTPPQAPAGPSAPQPPWAGPGTGHSPHPYPAGPPPRPAGPPPHQAGPLPYRNGPSPYQDGPPLYLPEHWPPLPQETSPWGRSWPPPRRRGPRWVLLPSALAGVVASVALIASIAVVSVTPQAEPQNVGTDLSALYDERLAARPEAVEVDIADHPLYDAAMPGEVECDVPEVQMDSEESWQEFATVTGQCLDEMWAPVMEELGLTVGTPEFTVTEESPDSGDEEGYTLAYYEGNYERITVVLPNVRQLGAFVPAGQREDVWIALMGHEYGHHVQYVTGILDISYEREYAAESEAESMEVLRRTELQAECMGGIGLRSITGADEESLRRTNQHFNSGGDLDTHGSAANRAHWLEQGWRESTVGACNTYGADSGLVS
ncbi:neutral zinc metallopeptidase [Nocardiopsis algeriensis]|uniref:Putative metalloprotease n=1 Tax=Nocardiopsis algeriensis TaxID=1478215 RepID=A0A841ING9_9ACTN|nr:neutral zinc metallopeptidase [Nocardiopsis algeriensis]MBB6119634.1 putative metalloprotease [Nocardiopsis algeriensis]